MTAAHHLDQEAPEIRVARRPAGWLLPYLSPDVQDCTTNHIPENEGQLPCAAVAVWKVVELYDMHATVSFWCESDLPVEHRPAADGAQYGDDCEMAASYRRDGFGPDEIAELLRTSGAVTR